MPASKITHRPVALGAGALIGCTLLGSAPAQAFTQAELEARVEVLSAQLEAMQAEIASLKAQSQLSSSIEETKTEAAATVRGAGDHAPAGHGCDCSSPRRGRGRDRCLVVRLR